MLHGLQDLGSNDNPTIRRMGFLHMAHNLDDKDVKHLRELFEKIDTSHNGNLSVQELHGYLKRNPDELYNDLTQKCKQVYRQLLEGVD